MHAYDANVSSTNSAAMRIAPPDAGTEPESLIKEARKRQRRRWLAAGVAVAADAYLFARTAWSADGTWLLYQGPGGHLWAYQVTSGHTRASSTPCCQYTVMAAAPSRSG